MKGFIEITHKTFRTKVLISVSHIESVINNTIYHGHGYVECAEKYDDIINLIKGEQANEPIN